MVDAEISNTTDRRSKYTSLVSSVRYKYKKEVDKVIVPEIYSTMSAINGVHENQSLSVLLEDYSISLSKGGDYVYVSIDIIIESLYHSGELHNILEALESLYRYYQLTVCEKQIHIHKIFLINGSEWVSIIGADI